MRPSQFHIIFIVFSITLATFFGIFFGIPKKVSNTNSVIIDERTQFQDLCRCALLSIGDKGSFAIDTTTGQEISLPLVAGIKRQNGYFDTYQSPAGDALAAMTDNRSKLQYAAVKDFTPKVLFTAPSNSTLASLAWSTDGQYIIAGLQVPEDGQPTEGSWPTTILSIEISTSQVRTLITRDQVKKLGLDSIFPLAVSAGGKSIIFVSGNLGSERYFVWKKSKPKLSTISVNIVGAIYSGMSSVGDGTAIWFISGQLHRLNIDTLKDEPIKLDTYSDEPFSKPSPDGRYVIYLHRIGQTQTGRLALLDLLTGEERELSSTAVPSPSGLSGSVWTPTASHLIFSRELNFPPVYSSIQTKILELEQQPDQLQSPPLLGDQLLTGLISLESIRSF